MTTANGHTRSPSSSQEPLGERERAFLMQEMVGNALLSRSDLFRQLMDPRRDIDSECGYPASEVGSGAGSINPELFRTLYERECIATRVVQVFPKECWQVQPLVYEDEDAEVITPFEEAWDALSEQLRGEQSWYQDEHGSPVWEHLRRADILSGIGHFGILLIGIDDGLNLDQPVEGVSTTDPGGGSAGRQDPKHGDPARLFGPSRNKRTYPSRPTKEMEWGPVYAPDAKTGRPVLTGNRRYDEKDGDEPVGGHPPRKPVRNANPKGCNQYKGCDVGGGESGESVVHHTTSVTEDEVIAKGSFEGYSKAIAITGARSIEAGNSKGIIIKKGDKIVGLTAYVHEKADLYVKMVASAEKGVGTQVMHELCKVAAKARKGIYLEGQAGARGFYEKLGMTMLGDDKNPPPDKNVGYEFSKKAVKEFARTGSTPVGNQEGDWVTGNRVVSSADALLSGAVGTDAQYVGVQLSPPEFPSSEPSTQRRKLLFLRTYDESLVQIVQYEADVRNPRFGQPVMYRITLNDPREQHSGIGLPMATVRVHWSRVIHIADNCGSSEIFGVPRLRPVLNRVLDLRKLYSGSAEMYWRGAFPGISLETVPQLGGDVQVDVKGTQDFMEQYMNGLQRYLILMGMSAKTLSPTVVDPSQQIDVQITAICIELGMPKRVFMGSERGELASTQDDDAWLDRLRERQQAYITPRIVVPFIDRLIQMGVLPQPGGKGEGKQPANGQPGGAGAEGVTGSKDGRSVATNADDTEVDDGDGDNDPADEDSNHEGGYSVEWPELTSLNVKDKAGVLLQKTQAYAAYVSGGIEAVIPPKDYLTRFDDMDEEEADAVLDAASKAHEDEDVMTMPPQVGGRDAAAPPGTQDHADAQAQKEQAQAMADAKAKAGPPGAGGKPGFPGGGGKGPPRSATPPAPSSSKPPAANSLTVNEALSILSEYV